MKKIFAFTIPGLDVLGKGVAYALKYLNVVTGDVMAWSIILMTIVMRAILFPLTYKQTKSMIAMQRLQPKIKELQQKYKDDKEKQGQEMMALYKENKVNPLGSCLPLILQLPIMFAVFEVLRSLSQKGSAYVKIIGSDAVYMFMGMDIRQTGQVMWKGGDYWQVILLIVLTILTGYVSSMMMITDPKQSKMMALMPLMMGFFAWILPGGVTIYLIVTNILTIGQQYLQLELEGFYDEKKRERLKTGVPLKWNEKVTFAVTNAGSKTLFFLKLKKEHKELKPVSAPKKEKSQGVKAGKGTPGKGKRAGSGKPVKKGW